MEKLRTLTIRKYRYLSCHRYFIFNGNKKYDESLILNVNNLSGSISFKFIDLANNEEIVFDNPSSGDYVIPLKKGYKMKLLILASKAVGGYKIIRKTIKE